MSRTSNDQYVDGRLVNGYDYVHQAWVIGGVYMDCSHPAAGEVLAPFPGLREKPTVFEGCNCYGRQHAGEKPEIGILNGSATVTA